MDIHERMADFVESGRPFCLLVALSGEGSTPRAAGAKAIVDEAGRLIGTIGGGAVEAEAMRAAEAAMRSGRPAVLDCALAGDTAAAAQPICGGAMRILVDPTAAKDAPAYRAAADASRDRRRGVLLTRVAGDVSAATTVSWHPESGMVATDWAPAGLDGDSIRACVGEGIARFVGGMGSRLSPSDTRRSDFSRDTCGRPEGIATEVAPTGDADDALQPSCYLVEPIVPRPRVLIAGGGHIGRALAAQALLVEFEVIVIDDRPEFADPSQLPNGVAAHCRDIADALAGWEMDDQTYVVIVTRDHHRDLAALRACIHKPVAYIGMIGSRRKVRLVHDSLVGSGVATEQDLDRVYAPIGLDIGAETVPEIATSILAQLIAVRRGSENRGQPPISAYRRAAARSRRGNRWLSPVFPIVHAIVLAAGRSRRMGTQKLLLPFAGSTVIGRIMAEVIVSNVREVHVVVGADGPAVAEALREYPVSLVTNPDPDGDMLSSVRCGMRAVPADCNAVLIVLGDQPGITTALCNRLIASLAELGRGIVVPVHDGHRGHPLLISTAYRDSVMAGYDSVGLRGLLCDHPLDVHEVAVSAEGWLTDMDYPADYARELARQAETRQPTLRRPRT